jgi:hypothetical protein
MTKFAHLARMEAVSFCGVQRNKRYSGQPETAPKQKSTNLSTGAFEKYLEKIIFSFLLLQALSLLSLLPELLS